MTKSKYLKLIQLLSVYTIIMSLIIYVDDLVVRLTVNLTHFDFLFCICFSHITSKKNLDVYSCCCGCGCGVAVTVGVGVVLLLLLLWVWVWVWVCGWGGNISCLRTLMKSAQIILRHILMVSYQVLALQRTFLYINIITAQLNIRLG